MVVKSEDQEDDISEGTTEGTFAVLELNPVTTQIIVGGVPDAFAVSVKANSELIIYDRQTNVYFDCYNGLISHLTEP